MEFVKKDKKEKKQDKGKIAFCQGKMNFVAFVQKDRVKDKGKGENPCVYSIVVLVAGVKHDRSFV